MMTKERSAELLKSYVSGEIKGDTIRKKSAHVLRIWPEDKESMILKLWNRRGIRVSVKFRHLNRNLLKDVKVINNESN